MDRITDLDKAILAIRTFEAPPHMKPAIMNVADTLQMARMACEEHLPDSATNGDVIAVCQMILAERERLIQADSAGDE